MEKEDLAKCKDIANMQYDFLEEVNEAMYNFENGLITYYECVGVICNSVHTFESDMEEKGYRKKKIKL